MIPTMAVIWYNLAVVQSKEHRPSRAIGSLDEALKLGIPADVKDAATELKGSLVYEMREWSKVQDIAGTWITSSRTDWEKPSRVRGVPCHGASDDGETIALKFDDGEGVLAGTYVVFRNILIKINRGIHRLQTVIMRSAANFIKGRQAAGLLST